MDATPMCPPILLTFEVTAASDADTAAADFINPLMFFGSFSDSYYYVSYVFYIFLFFVLPTTTILLQHRSKFAAILVLCWCWLMYILYHFFSLYFIASNLLPRSETIRFPPNSLLLISLPSSTKLGRTRVQKIYIYFVANPVNQRIYYGKSVVLKWQNIYKIKSF